MIAQVLVVDDSEPFRRVVAELLGLRGFEVTAAVADADAAVIAVGKVCPDAILLDINLADGNGYAVSLLLTAACPGARVVLTSSDVDDVAVATLTACRASAFVPKAALATVDLAALLARDPRELTDRGP